MAEPSRQRRLLQAAIAIAIAAPASAADPMTTPEKPQPAALWPWASQAPAKPPAVKPFEVPTFGAKREFRSSIAQWIKAPRVDGDAVFREIINCYPSKTQWNIDVNLDAAVRNANIVDITGTSIGRASVGIVARMPLYSATEMDREREREAKRRQDTAGKIATFIQALAERNQALRMLGISAAMESRAQIRVNEGIADATEQIGYLKDIAKLEQDIIAAEAKAMDARLSMVAMCRDDVAHTINEYLTGLSRFPEDAKP